MMASPTKGNTDFHGKLEKVFGVREVQEGSSEKVVLEEQKLSGQREEGERSFQAKGPAYARTLRWKGVQQE